MVVSLTPDRLEQLKNKLVGPGVFGSNGDVIHTQVESEGKLVFGAYDNFHKDCVVACEPISEAFLDELVKRGMLRSFRAAV